MYCTVLTYTLLTCLTVCTLSIIILGEGDLFQPEQPEAARPRAVPRGEQGGSWRPQEIFFNYFVCRCLFERIS